MKVKYLVIIVVTILLAIAGWQTVACKVANVQLGDDLHDMSSQLGARTGFNAPLSDDDYRALIIRKANGYGITLKPEQVTIQRTETGNGTANLYLAVDYEAPVKLPGYMFSLHFTSSSEKN